MRLKPMVSVSWKRRAVRLKLNLHAAEADGVAFTETPRCWDKGWGEGLARHSERTTPHLFSLRFACLPTIFAAPSRTFAGIRFCCIRFCLQSSGLTVRIRAASN